MFHSITNNHVLKRIISCVMMRKYVQFTSMIGDIMSVVWEVLNAIKHMVCVRLIKFVMNTTGIFISKYFYACYVYKNNTEFIWLHTYLHSYLNTTQHEYDKKLYRKICLQKNWFAHVNLTTNTRELQGKMKLIWKWKWKCLGMLSNYQGGIKNINYKLLTTLCKIITNQLTA